MASYRTLNLLGFAGCTGGLLFAILFLQQALGYEPCPMCIFQRVAMLATGLLFLLAALHAPHGGGRWVYALLTLLAPALAPASPAVTSGCSHCRPIRFRPAARRSTI